MPSVPTYQRQVSDQAFPGVRVSTGAPLEAFGGGQSSQEALQSGQRLIEQQNQMVLEEKRKADDLAATQAYEQATKLKNDLEWNPKTGAYLKQGQNAFGIVDEYKPQFDKGLDDIESSLNNADQRAMFNKIRGKLSNEFSEGMNRHIGQESKRFDVQQTDATIATTRNDAVLNAYTDGKVDDSIRLQSATAAGFAERMGLPPEVLKQQIEEIRSKTNRAVIEKYVNDGAVNKAKERYAGVSGDAKGLTAADDEYVKALLKGGDVKRQSQIESDRIYSMGLGESAALREARKIDNPDIRDEAERRIKVRYSDDERIREKNSRARFDRAVKLIHQSGDRDALPLSLEMELEPDQIAVLDKYAPAERDNRVVPTKPIEKQIFLARLSNPATMDAASKEDLNKKINDYSPADLEDLKKLQKGVRDKDEKAMDQINSYMKNSLRGKATLKQAGLDKDPEELLLFMDRFQKRVKSQFETTGRYPDDDETQKIMDTLVLDAEEQGRFIDVDKKVYQISPKKQIIIDYDAIPESERTRIENGLKDRKLPVTKSEVQRLYTKWLNRNR